MAPDSQPARRIVAVVGMHRSGTSMTMQGLDLLGVQPGGALLEGDEFNRRGYWEAAEIVAFHDDLLFEMGRPWGTPEHALGVSPAWFDTARATEAAAQATDLLRARLDAVDSGRVLALKDPRMSLFLPLWQIAAERLSAQLSLICCLRHPDEVAASLGRRDSIGPEMAHVLWTSYQTAVLDGVGNLPLLILPFSAWREAPRQTSDRVARFLDLPTNPDTAFAADLTTSLPLSPPTDAVTRFWWDRLSDLAAGGCVGCPRNEAVWYHRQVQGHVSSVVAGIRAEQDETPTAVLLRDLDSFRKGYADMQKLRLGDQDWISQQRQNLDRLESDLATFRARATEMERAYQDSAKQSEAFRQAYQDSAKQSEALRQAYLAKAAKYEKLVAFFRKLQPWTWFSSK